MQVKARNNPRCGLIIGMVLKKKILILEDDLNVLSKILSRLDKLEEREIYSFHHVILADQTQVEDYINNNPQG